MSLATLLNIPNVNDPASFAEFTFSNMDEHRRIVSAIFAQRGVNLTVYPLDPVPSYALATWFQLHQQAHNDMTSVLGISNFDISDVDFRNREETQAWVRLHFDMHQQASQLLGIN